MAKVTDVVARIVAYLSPSQSMVKAFLDSKPGEVFFPLEVCKATGIGSDVLKHAVQIGLPAYSEKHSIEGSARRVWGCPAALKLFNKELAKRKLNEA